MEILENHSCFIYQTQPTHLNKGEIVTNAEPSSQMICLQDGKYVGTHFWTNGSFKMNKKSFCSLKTSLFKKDLGVITFLILRKASVNVKFNRTPVYSKNNEKVTITIGINARSRGLDYDVFSSFLEKSKLKPDPQTGSYMNVATAEALIEDWTLGFFKEIFKNGGKDLVMYPDEKRIDQRQRDVKKIIEGLIRDQFKNFGVDFDITVGSLSL